MNILVTGGAGFIGSNFVRWLLKNQPNTNLKITVLDALTYAGHLISIEDLIKNNQIEFIEGNICNEELLKKVIPKQDLIFNFAAESHVDRSIDSADAFVKTNIFGTYQILECVRKHSAQTRLMQISTDEVYGSLGDTGFFTEDSQIKPSSPYSASKASADLLVQSYGVTYKANTIITRSSNNYGPYQLPEKFLPVIITKLFNNEKIPVYGNGKNVRDWLFVEDNCAGIWLASQKGRTGNVYNFGGGCEKSNLELVHSVLELLGKDQSSISFVTDRPGHDFRYAVDASKAAKELGWKPKATFNEAIENTINWYKQNGNWIKTVSKQRSH